ncbi:hypothetical protein [uncultured Draconibacterium sp.]|uniref:hypothetical protein n=1 Tax=uncultured Draconibacterium sp. TaxID=1573823 RepID=UPI0025D62F0D|nr:hypothetical protein [uncultured Draconibacterium sp.]
MRFIIVSLFLSFLSFTQWNACAQSQSLSFSSNYLFAPINNTQKVQHQLSLYAYGNSSVTYLKSNHINAVNSYSGLTSSTYASERTSAENGAILGGLAGFLAGGVVGGLANPETNLAVSAIALILNDEEENEVMEEQVPYIIIGTLVGVGIGALIGKRRNRVTIHDREYLIDFQPVFASVPTSTNNMVLGLNISFRY